MDSVLTEKNYSGPLYHLTTISHLIEILGVGDGEAQAGLRFANAAYGAGNERRFMRSEKYPYYLSTARNLRNAFRDMADSVTTPYRVSLVLDTAYLNKKGYLVTPVNYFTGAAQTPIGHKAKEAEERVWSKNQFNPLNMIKEIHIYLRAIDIEEREHAGFGAHPYESKKSTLDQILEANKSFNIPLYFYIDHKHYLMHNKAESKPVDEIRAELTYWLERRQKKKYNESTTLTEKHYSGPLYHMTSIGNLRFILAKGFKFSDSQFNKWEKRLRPAEGYNYFLSTARSLKNFFRTEVQFRRVSIVLDGAYFSKGHYIIKPVDYFGGYGAAAKLRIPGNSESEERIWSRKQMNPINSIMEVHISCAGNIPAELEKNIRHDEKLLKDANIPAYFYRDKKDYLFHRKDKAFTSVEEALYGGSTTVIQESTSIPSDMRNVFGKILFGEWQHGEGLTKEFEADTEYEKKVLNAVQRWIGSGGFNNERYEYFKVLSSATPYYPTLLKPPTEDEEPFLYRGILKSASVMPLHHDKFEKISTSDGGYVVGRYTIYKYQGQEKYIPKQPVESWTISFNDAMEFVDNNYGGETWGEMIIFEAAIPNKERLFNAKFTNAIGSWDENEIIRLSKKPIQANIYKLVPFSHSDSEI